MPFTFEIDPQKPNNPNRLSTRKMPPRNKLALTLSHAIKGLEWTRATRLRMSAALASIPETLHSSNQLSEQICVDILDEIFPLWRQDVYYPPMETRQMLREMAEEFSAELVSERGTWAAFIEAEHQSHERKLQRKDAQVKHIPSGHKQPTGKRERRVFEP